MALTPGTRLGVYEIIAPIGEGGMGQVLRARDTKLDRDIAIKILPEAFAHDVDRLARFQREAKTLASLNHPNIAAIYGLEERGGMTALVMELVEGDDLSQRIARGAIPLDDALPIAKQIAEALEAAHEQGIIHRDLKPANIKVRPDGTVKVLDFGLARAMEPPAGSSPSMSMSPTITTPAMTQAGMILGTAAYMSPEQAKGRTVDKRSDVWAFGVVLYEMLTGTRAFEGDDVSDTLARVLMKEPDWTALPARLPSAVVTVIRRCLQKDHKQRVRDIGDVSLALEGAFETTARPNAARDAQASAGFRRTVVPWLAGIVVCSGVTAAAVWTMTRSVDRPTVPLRFVVTLPETDRLPGSSGSLVAVSPDGRTLLYRALQNAVFRLYVRPLGQFQATAIGDPGAGESPAFSPDGQWVAFQVGNVIRKVPVAGGPSQTVGEVSVSSRGMSWEADGTILVGLGTKGVGRLPAAGGTLTTLVTPSDKRLYWYPQMLPGGRAVLYTASDPRPDAGEIQVLTLDTGERRTLVPGAAGRFLPSGHLVFVRGASLWAVPFDPERLEVRGTPVPVVEGIRVEPGGAVQVSVGDDGTLVYLPGGAATGLRLLWVDRAGQEELIGAPARQFRYPRLSPDGTRVAVADAGDERDVWVWHFARKTLTRLTFDAADDSYATWTSDGRRILFSSARDKVNAPFWQLADGTGTTDRLVAGTATPLDQAMVSPDGRRVVMRATMATTGADLVVVDLADKARPQPGAPGGVRPLVQTKFMESNPEISPDGHWLAYQSDESGAAEIYVRPFPDVDAGRWQVSAGGGTHPQWARDGSELFYLSPDDWIRSVPIQSEKSFTFGSATRVVDLSSYYTQLQGRNYDVSADGRRFLVARGEEQGLAEVRVVVNWSEELKRLVPTR